MRHKHKRTNKPLDKTHPPSKGKPNHRVIAKLTEGNRTYTLHATKGYRSTVA